jgi:dolichyl-phosphate beta-glucosyltransferase
VTAAGPGRPSLSVIVPAFNEARRIAATVTALATYFDTQGWDWELIVADDGSTDETAGIVESLAVAQPRVRVLRQPHRGKGGAVRAGMLAAIGQHRFMCDADLAMPVSQIPAFLDHMARGVDVAIGSREGHDARRIGEPLYRHLVGRVFNGVVQLLALPGIEDSQCGFKMFTAAAAERVFSQVTTDGWAFDVEALAIARRLGLRIIEVPIEWHFVEASKLRVLPDGVEMLRELWRIRRRT